MDRSSPPEAAAESPSGAAAAPLLEARHLTLRYEGTRAVTALEDVSFVLAKGQRLSVVGRSGCGKSSLLRAVGGFLKPAKGEILLDGAPISKPAPDRMTVFQDFDQLFGWKTVEENVRFVLRTARHLSRSEARDCAAFWLDRVGLSAFASAYPHTLSGGMKQRVAIARAFALEPRVLLMDEPFAALDALTRRAMQDELLRLTEETGATLVFVTHAIDEALRIGTDMLALMPHPGRVAARIVIPTDATPAELAEIEKEILEAVLRNRPEFAAEVRP